MRTLFAGEPDFELAEAADADQLVEAARAARPDVVLVDLHLPPGGGIAALARLSEVSDAPAIVWSFEPRPETVLTAIRAGARGYLRKEMPPEGLVRALRALARGEAPLARDLTSLLIDELHSLEERERARDRLAVLSAREREVLALVAAGASNREIAARLFVSEFTVKRHVQNLLRKLGLSSRRAAAAFHRAAAA